MLCGEADAYGVLIEQLRGSQLALYAELREPGAAEPPGADAALHEALFSLPPKYRVPLILTCLDGYTMREAAHMLGVPEGTVKARLHRARLQLRERLGEEETDDA